MVTGSSLFREAVLLLVDMGIEPFITGPETVGKGAQMHEKETPVTVKKPLLSMLLYLDVSCLSGGKCLV